MTDIATMALFIAVYLLLAMMPLALVWLLYREGIISRQQAEQAVRDMANVQVRI